MQAQKALRIEILFRLVKQFLGARLTIRNEKASDARLIAVFLAALLLILLQNPRAARQTFVEPNVRLLRRARSMIEKMSSG